MNAQIRSSKSERDATWIQHDNFHTFVQRIQLVSWKAWSTNSDEKTIPITHKVFEWHHVVLRDFVLFYSPRNKRISECETRVAFRLTVGPKSVGERFSEEAKRRLSNIYESSCSISSSNIMRRRMIHFILTQKNSFTFSCVLLPPLLYKYLCSFRSTTFTKLENLPIYTRNTWSDRKMNEQNNHSFRTTICELLTSRRTRNLHKFQLNQLACGQTCDRGWKLMQAFHCSTTSFQASCWELVSRKLSVSILISSEIKRRHKHRDC